MINLICCIKSPESFSRIYDTFKEDNNFSLEDFVKDFEKIQENITIKQYDLAVIDEKLPWKDPALDLFNKKGTKIIIFKGDFRKTINDVYKLFPILEEAKEHLKKREPQSKHGKVSDQKIKYIVKEKLAEKEANLGTPVYKEIYKGIENKLIIVTGLSKKAGSTFLSINLAKALSGLKIRTSIIEPPIDNPYLFDYLGIDGKFDTASSEYNFYSYPHVINNGIKPLRDMEAIIDDIIWIIPDSRINIIDNWDSLKMMKLLYASKKAPISIVDIGTSIEHESIDPILTSADMILAVINPQPVELKQNKDRLETLLKLKKEGYPVEFVINFYNSSINRKVLSNYLNISPSIFIPAINHEHIYMAGYKNKIPLDYPEVEEQLFKPLSGIIKNIIPLELFRETLKDKSSFNSSNIIQIIKERFASLKNLLYFKN